MRKLLVKYMPGRRPPERILKELQRRYRDVALFWEAKRQRWALVQLRLGQRPWLIRLLENADGSFALPTYGNTIAFLRQAHWSNYASKFARERLQNELDRNANAAAEAARADHADRWREGAERIRRLYSPKLVVAR